MPLAKLSTALVVTVLISLVPISTAWATTKQEAQAAIAEAKAMREQAAAAGIDSTDSAEMIAEAEALIDTRQYTKAVMISNWAVRQDQFALETSTGTAAVDQNQEQVAQAMIEAAEAARAKAAEVGGEWRDVGEMLKEAQSLMKAGEFDKAIELAATAKFQSERGYEQAMAEKDADFPGYMFKAVGQ
jgi:tetratricopeptide (TPR) repeat protein